MHRRPMGLVAAGWFGFDVTLLAAGVSLFMGSPAISLTALCGAQLALALTGFFPRDRDIEPKARGERWQRVTNRVIGGVLVGNFANLFLPLPFATETAIAAVLFGAQTSLVVVLTRVGKPMTDDALAQQIASGDIPPQVAQMMNANPGRWGRRVRRAVASLGCVVALAIAGSGILLVVRSEGAVPPFRWAELPVRYCIDESEGYMDREYVVENVAWAFETWGVPAEYEGTCTAAMTNGDGVSAVGWREIGEDTDGVEPWGQVWWDRDRCQFFCNYGERHGLIEADITFDPTPEDLEDAEYCFDHVTLHEVGHFLGLEHTAGPGVMSEDADCEWRLSEEDRAAVYQRYGRALEQWAARGR